MEQKYLLQQMMVGYLDSYMQKNETKPPTYIIHKNKLKMDKRLKYVSTPKKVLEENISREISDFPCSNIFTDTPLSARDIKETINKWEFIKIRSFCKVKENISKMKREPVMWVNIFANDTSDIGLISKIYKEIT